MQVQLYLNVEAEVKAARSRLGGGTEKEVRRREEANGLAGPLGEEYVQLLREVAGLPGVDEALRRDVEVKEFEYWRKLVASLS